MFARTFFLFVFKADALKGILSSIEENTIPLVAFYKGPKTASEYSV